MKQPEDIENDVSLLKKEILFLRDWKQKAEGILCELGNIGNTIIIGEIIGSLAHELNQPLNGIRIICQSILKDMEKNRLSLEYMVDDMSDSISNVDLMTKKIDHIRNYFSRSGVKYSRKVNINPIIKTICGVIGQQLRNRKIEFVINLQSGLPEIIINPIDVELVILAMVINARKSVEIKDENQKKKIEVRSSLQTDAVSHIVIETAYKGVPVQECNINQLIFMPDINLEAMLSFYAMRKSVESYNGKFEIINGIDDEIIFTVKIPVVA